jgi:hypothetical protein
MYDKLLKSKQGIRLDVGCGDNKQPNCVGMDRRKRPGVDIVWDVQDLPWKPFPDECCTFILMSHLYEHIEPKYRIDVIDECWRIMKVDGELWIASPYYQSAGAYQDPTHYTCPTEASFTYFDPDYPLYGVYKPKPWKLKLNDYFLGGSLNAILVKRKEGKK